MDLSNESRNPQLARWTNLKALAIKFGGNNLHGLCFAFRDIVRPKFEALFIQGFQLYAKVKNSITGLIVIKMGIRHRDLTGPFFVVALVPSKRALRAWSVAAESVWRRNS